MEINASPAAAGPEGHPRGYRARELGVPLVINTDSHHIDGLTKRTFGVAVARRAWCGPEHVLNTYPASKFLAWLRSPKGRRAERFAAMVEARRAAATRP